MAAARREFVASLDRGRVVPDPDFTRITRLAAIEIGAPVALISLLDGDRLWFYSRHGIELEGAPLRRSFCETAANTLDTSELVVLDAAADPRFASGALVAGPPHIRFYAGVPLAVHGQKIGTLCAVSPEPREIPPSAEQVARLTDLAALTSSLFELKDEARVRARMAADLIREEWRHALTLEAGKVGSWVWDIRSGELVCNDIFRRMFDLPAGTLKVDDLLQRISRLDIGAVNAALKATFEEGADYAVEFRVAEGDRWLIGRGRVYQRDGAGKPLVMMGVNIDVTEERQAAERTHVLLRELNHRVKNTLAMIQALARQTLRQKPDPQEFMDAFSGRLRTLTAAHELLADRDWSGLGLVELLHMQVDPHLLYSEDQLVLAGEDVDLLPDQALGLGIILHELASNAGKYGGLSLPGGRVSIRWTIGAEPEKTLRLSWSETGGPEVQTNVAAGFGTRLIQRSLDKVLGSSVSLSFLPSGATAEIVVPLA